eukprot:3787114-Rhodomonas_salina.2
MFLRATRTVLPRYPGYNCPRDSGISPAAEARRNLQGPKPVWQICAFRSLPTRLGSTTAVQDLGGARIETSNRNSSQLALKGVARRPPSTRLGAGRNEYRSMVPRPGRAIQSQRFPHTTRPATFLRPAPLCHI